ncbi:hypothetical protein SNE40_020892 [Patella caerulea]|uniref:Uncharacterized protein n=1 Tax=Patella caerulea TaxID=87958 RepID=A0AAN8J4G2_PATCE
MAYKHIIYLPYCGIFICVFSILTYQVWASNPEIIEHPQDDYVAKNEPATLNCKAEGDPTPKITWYLNGKPVITSPENPSSHRMLLPSGQLFFLRIIHNKNSKPDVGVYYCNATNIHGSAISRNATLEIAVLRDEFREEPTDVTVATGKTATFNCKAPKGEPEPDILWHKNNDPVQDDGRLTFTNGNLIIQSVQVSDVGEYTCLAINKGGEKESRPAKLTVLEKPKFSHMPSDEVANEQDIVELKCQATGDPKPTLEWRKEDGRIPYGRARQLNDGTLRIEKVEASDDGTYVCVAENDAGTVEAVGKLIVNTHPSFQVRPENQVVGRGRTVTLQCVVTGNPTPTVFWSKGTEQNLMFPNQENGRFSVAEDGTFRVERVRFDDAGEYVCQALNVIGSDKASAIIEVREQDSRPPPIIRIGPQNQTLPSKEVAWLPCEAIGDPQPTIRWYMSGRPIVTNDHRITVLDSGTLQISDVRVADSATYTCKAVSETGETTWSSSLAVTSQGPYHRVKKASTLPGAPSKPIITDVTDTSVHLTWQPNRNPGDSPVFEFIVEYFSHETPEGWKIASSSVTRESITVRNLLPNTHYVFMIRARNSHGIGLPSDISDLIVTRERRKPHSRVNLTRKEIEEKLDGMVIEVLKGESLNSTAIKVTWRPLKGFDAMDGYIIKYKQIKDLRKMKYGSTESQRIYDPHITSYTLSGLHSYAWYEICVQAFGGDVKSVCSDKIKVPTKESIPTSPPENIMIDKKDNNALHVRWSQPNREHRNGNIIAYEIYCMDNDKKHNCSLRANGTTYGIHIKNIDSETTYRIKIAARTNSGVGTWSKMFIIGPEQPNIMKEPWFIGMLISTIGGTLWLALCVFSIWLCRKRKNRKKLAQNGMYSAVPVHKTEESSRSVADVVYAQKDGNIHSNMSGYGGLQSDLASLLENGCKDVELKDQNIYNTAGMIPQMKTFYQKPNTIPVSVAPYATTTLINTTGMPGHSHQGSNTCMESTFRPINHAYVHSSGSGDSCQKPELRSSDSHSENSGPNTNCHHENMEMLSPASDSGSLTTDEYGMPVKRNQKVPKHMYQGKQGMVNWSELLPPPPEHPPPSDLGSPSESPINTLQRLERQAYRQNNDRSPISPVSKISACSCPVPHDRMPTNIRNVAYSDNEFGMHSPRMHECRPYSPKQLNSRQTRSPVHDGRMSPSKMYNYEACHHMADKNDYNNVYLPLSFYNDNDNRNGVMGASVFTPAALQGYHVEPNSRMCTQCSQDGVSVDRACQSSLPSLASECVHSNYQSRNGDSPVSEEIPDYCEESDVEATPPYGSSINEDGYWVSTDQANTSSSSCSHDSSDESFLAEADFASAVAKAAEMSGLTVVGTTVSDPKNVRKYRKHQRATPRPSSPYSTDSNMSAVVHKPYPKSQRKKQLADQARFPKQPTSDPQQFYLTAGEMMQRAATNSDKNLNKK